MTGRIARRTAFALAVGAACTSMSAHAQLAGGPIVPANPGGFSGDIALGIFQTDMSPYSLGQVGRFNGVNTPVSGGFLNDNNSNHFAVSPSTAMSWGLPGGLFGGSAEIWGRFSYKDTANSPSATVGGGGVTTTIPYIDALHRVPLPFGQTFTFMDFGQVSTVQRSQTSYDTEAGGRVNFPIGNMTVSPAAFFGYQRIDQVDAMLSTITAPSDVSQMNVTSKLSTDYYRFGLGIGTSMPVTFIGPTVSWFNYLSGSLDVVDSRFNAQQAVNFGFFINPALQTGANFRAASASGSHSDIGGHVAFQTGLVNQSSPAFAQFVAVSVGYISNVPFVNYPQFAGGLIVAGANLTHPAQLSSTGQTSYGITAGFNFRF